jgi:hypothetical protein
MKHELQVDSKYTSCSFLFSPTPFLPTQIFLD